MERNSGGEDEMESELAFLAGLGRRTEHKTFAPGLNTRMRSLEYLRVGDLITI